MLKYLKNEYIKICLKKISFIFLLQVCDRFNHEQTDQLRSEIDSTLRDLEQSQKLSNRTTMNKFPSRFSRSSPPLRNNYRSSSADEQRNHRLLPKISFENDSINER